MVTRQVKLTKEQNKTLEQLATSQGRDVGDLIREGVDVVLSESEVAADLTRRIAAGDTTAEEELVERYSQGLFYLLRRLVPDVADDHLSETFRLALERLRRGQLSEPEQLAGFLRGIARDLVIAERRKTARRRTEADKEELAQAVHPAPDQLSALLLDEERETVRRLIRELSTDRDRQLLLRYYILEEEKERISADLGIDSISFDRILYRARRRFKELLERQVPSLAERESELLLAINRGLSGEVAERYHELIQRRQAGILNQEEHRELLRLTDEVERLQAERIESLSKLARLRGISLGSLMEKLEIRPASNA